MECEPGTQLHCKGEEHHREAQIRKGHIKEIVVWRKRRSRFTVHDDNRTCTPDVLGEYVSAHEGQQDQTNERREARSRGQSLYDPLTAPALKKFIDTVGTDDGNAQ